MDGKTIVTETLKELLGIEAEEIASKLASLDQRVSVLEAASAINSLSTSDSSIRE